MHQILQMLRNITAFVSKLLSSKFLPYKYNDRRVLIPNFKAVGYMSLNSKKWMRACDPLLSLTY